MQTQPGICQGNSVEMLRDTERKQPAVYPHPGCRGESQSAAPNRRHRTHQFLNDLGYLPEPSAAAGTGLAS